MVKEESGDTEMILVDMVKFTAGQTDSVPLFNEAAAVMPRKITAFAQLWVDTFVLQ